MEPVVSVILTTGGDRPSVADALRSVLAQDFADLEVIVVDDARSGATWREAEPVAALLRDPRVRLVAWNRRLGPPAARNAGWRAARGRWLCYLDDDNAYLPGKVRAQHALAESTGAPVVLCGIEYHIGSRRRVKQTAATEFRGDGLLLDALADTNLLFHRRDVAARWEEDLGTGDDACLFQAILAETGAQSAPNVPLPLVAYQVHAGPRANPHAGRHHGGQRRLLTKWCGRYSREARRVQLCRSLLTDDTFTPGRWGRLARHAVWALRTGGGREWRMIANTIGVKLPLVRRWLIT